MASLWSARSLSPSTSMSLRWCFLLVPALAFVRMQQSPPRRPDGGVTATMVQSVAGGVVAMPLLIVGIVAAAALGEQDAEGTVARRLPPKVANYLVRDCRLAWLVFTSFELSVGFLTLSRLKAQSCGISFVAACRTLTDEWRQTKPERVQLSPLMGVDVYPSRNPGAPLVLFVPGGAWSHGDVSGLWRLFARELSTSLDGAAVAVVDYAVWPRADGAAMVSQVASAIEWATSAGIAAPSARFGFDPQKVVVLGFSAGAHLAAAALLAGHENASSLTATRARAAVLCSGVYDLERHAKFEHSRGVGEVSALAAAFPGDARRRYSPVSRLRDGDAARLPDGFHLSLVHGELDKMVPRESTEDFATELRRALAGRACTVRTHDFPHVGHTDYILEAMLNPHAHFLNELKQILKDADV